MERKIRVALPSKGRLKKTAMDVLQHAGVEILKEGRAYVADTSDPRFEAIFARAFDIPIYIHYGAVDLGITGHDLILERAVDVHDLFDLGFGKCQLIAATSKTSPVNSVSDIQDVTKVATEYPNLARKYFEASGKQVEILRVRGTSELAVELGVAQICVDVASTGETLRKNNLKVIATILDSTCRLASNRIAYRTFEKEIQEFINRLQKGEPE